MTNPAFKSSSTELNNINHQVSSPSSPSTLVVRSGGGDNVDPDWIHSMKEDFIADYSIETISDNYNSPGPGTNSNVYSTYSLPPTSASSNKYARVKRQHVNGDVGNRDGLHSLQRTSYS